MNIKKSDIVNMPVMAMYREGYYFCMMHLFIRCFVRDGDKISVFYTDDHGIPHKTRVYNPFEDSAYFIHAGYRVRVSDCEYMEYNDHGFLDRTGAGVVLTDRPEFGGKYVTLI